MSQVVFSAQVQFSGVEQVTARMSVYELQVLLAIRQVGNYFAAKFETYAKENAEWEDQTGNARQGLHAFVEELARDSVQLFLSHGVTYGLWLEVKWAGRYAIIWPTIEAHLDEIASML